MLRLTVIDAFCPQDLVLSFDIRIEKLDEVEVVRHLLPLDEILDPVLVPDVAFSADVGERVDIGMDRCKEKSEIRDVASGDLPSA